MRKFSEMTDQEIWDFCCKLGIAPSWLDIEKCKITIPKATKMWIQDFYSAFEFLKSINVEIPHYEETES